MEKITSEQEHVRHFLHKRVTRTLLDVSRCSRAKQRQIKKCTIKVCCTCKVVVFFGQLDFLLFVCLFVCFFYRSRCLRCLAFQTERNVTKRQVIHNGSLGSLCGDYHELLANQADATKCTLCERTGKTW